MIGYYRIEMDVNGKTRHDIEFGHNAQNAVDRVKESWESMGEVKIIRVYKDCDTRWEITEDWE